MLGAARRRFPINTMQIRKVEQITSYLATAPVEIDPEKFRNISEPYTGDSEQEFVDYLAGIFPYSIPEDLDDETKEILSKLHEADMEEYSSSLDKGEKIGLQVGEEDFNYRKTGGFRVDAEADV